MMIYVCCCSLGHLLVQVPLKDHTGWGSVSQSKMPKPSTKAKAETTKQNQRQSQRQRHPCLSVLKVMHKPANRPPRAKHSGSLRMH